MADPVEVTPGRFCREDGGELTMAAATSELGFWTRRIGYRDRYLRSALALRRGPDQWVIWDGFHPGLFLNKAKEWGNGQRGRSKTMWTTAEVLAVCPKIIRRDTRCQFPHIPENEIVVHVGYLPDL